MATAKPLPFDPIAEAHRQWTAHGWAAAADGMIAVTSLMRAQQIVQLRVDEVLKPFGISFARYEVLMLLYFSRANALPMSKIGVRLQVHPTTVTSAVDRLEAQGLVRRQPHPTNRRTTLTEITEAGLRTAAEATAALNATVFTSPGVPAERLTDLVSVLTDLRRDAGDFV